ncbi:MAG: hypothetical protein DDT18_02015 [Actinobacteria bacterium]|nr:hypothetical protein [Actinomycetota bacterium]
MPNCIWGHKKLKGVKMGQDVLLYVRCYEPTLLSLF